MIVSRPTPGQAAFREDLCGHGLFVLALFHQAPDTSGLQLIMTLKVNMQNRCLPRVDKMLLRQRAIAEAFIDQLKNISQIEHTRHRSFTNFLVNLLCGLIAYCQQPKEPSLQLDIQTRSTTA